MSSILTNNSAMTALQSLSATQKSLATTQAQISSGLRIANASDNAAYWSIATKMTSDNAALSSVTDALNLGASSLSTASTTMSAEITTLQAMKASLVSAQQAGTDRVAIQSSISADQAQLKSAAVSASFNGVNYLAADTTSSSYNANVNIVSSFSRDASNNVTTSFISTSRNSTLLYNTGSATNAPSGVTISPSSAGPTNTNYTVASFAKMSGILDTAQTQVTAAQYTTYTGASTVDGSLAHLQASVSAINTWNNQSATAKGLDTTSGGQTTGATAGTPPALTANDLNALKLYQAGITGANTTVDGSNNVLSTTVTGKSVSNIDISALTDSATDQTTLANMVTQVDQAITSLTSAASQIGSAQTRVTAQSTFVTSLSDALTSGVGSLVDADMNVASTRLQALQTQQQLGIQSLSIANQNSQLILKLFQG